MSALHTATWYINEERLRLNDDMRRKISGTFKHEGRSFVNSLNKLDNLLEDISEKKKEYKDVDTQIKANGGSKKELAAINAYLRSLYHNYNRAWEAADFNLQSLIESDRSDQKRGSRLTTEIHAAEDYLSHISLFFSRGKVTYALKKHRSMHLKTPQGKDSSFEKYTDRNREEFEKFPAAIAVASLSIRTIYSISCVEDAYLDVRKAYFSGFKTPSWIIDSAEELISSHAMSFSHLGESIQALKSRKEILTQELNKLKDKENQSKEKFNSAEQPRLEKELPIQNKISSFEKRCARAEDKISTIQNNLSKLKENGLSENSDIVKAAELIESLNDEEKALSSLQRDLNTLKDELKKAKRRPKSIRKLREVWETAKNKLDSSNLPQELEGIRLQIKEQRDDVILKIATQLFNEDTEGLYLSQEMFHETVAFLSRNRSSEQQAA